MRQQGNLHDCFSLESPLTEQLSHIAFSLGLWGLCPLGDLGLDHTVICLRIPPYSGPFAATLS